MTLATWKQRVIKSVGSNWLIIALSIVWTFIIGQAVYRLTTRDDFYGTSTFTHLLNGVNLILDGMVAGVLVSRGARALGERRGRRKAAEDFSNITDALLLPCPACHQPIKPDELQRHLHEAHSDPEHVTIPIMSLIRNPGQAEWTAVRKDDA